MRNTMRTEPNARRRPSKRTTPKKHIGRTLPRKRAEPDGTFRNLEVRELKPSERVRNQSGQTTGKRQKRARQKPGSDIGLMTFPSRHTSM